MTFNEYQAKVVYDHATYPMIGQNVIWPALGLAGEAGEVANKVKRAILANRPMTTFENAALAAEIGEALSYVAALAYELGWDLEEIAHQNIAKLQRRKQLGSLAASD